MRTLLKIVLGLVVLVVIAVGVVVFFVIDVNDYKDEITARAEAAIGRQVVIDGDIDLRLGLTTALSVDGVKVANAPWASEPEMLTVERFSAEVAVLPLLRGNLEIKTLRLRGARVSLERNQAGQANWEFAAPGGADGAAGGDQPPPQGPAGGEVKIPVLQEVVVEDLRLTFRDAATGQDIDLALENVRLTGEGPDSPLQLALAGSYNELPFRIEGELGAPSTLAGNSPYPLNVRAEALGLSVGIDGSIAQPAAATGLNLRLTVEAEDLSGLAAIAGDGLPSGGPLLLATVIRGDPSRIELAELEFSFGPTELSGGLQVSLAGARPKLTGNLESPRIDLTALLPPDGPPDAPPDGQAPGTPPEPPEAESGRVLPDTPLPLAGLRAADIDLAIQVAELITPSLTVQDVTIGLRLDNGVLTVDPLAATAVDSALTGRVRLDATTDIAALEVDLSGPALDLGALVLEFTGQDIIRGSAVLDVSLRGEGASVAGIAGSLNGHSRLVMEEGMARTESFDLIVGGLTGVVSSLFSGQEEFTVVNCLAANLRFENGMATTLALIDTDLIVVTGEGTMNLADESLDLTVTPESKSPTLSLAVPINVGGTFADPSFRPDALSTACKVGGLVGAVLGTAVFPPAALLALSDLGAADNSCVSEEVEGGAAAAEQAPADIAPADLAPAESLGDAVKGLGEGLRGLFNR